MVLNDTILKQLDDYCIPPLSEWDNDLSVAWFVPREVIEKKTKNGKPYWIVKTIDNTSTMNSIKCWGVNREKDKISVNRPYVGRLDYSEEWGFSTRSIKHNFRLLN